MSFSSLDFISPKITLNYNGHNSHSSRIGGFFSLCLLIIIIVLLFYCFWELINPKYCTSFIYDEDVITNKIFQKINYLGLNHFIQIYSHINNGYFGNIDNKNIIIYGIKDNNKIHNNNDDILNLELSNIEHWLYDKCEKISDIQENLFSQISNIVSNYTSSICLRYYYNPIEKKYYEIGNTGYVEPFLETNNLKEKKHSYKIIIKKCVNSPFINEYLGFKCNNENEINKYLDIYKEIFIYFSNNRIVPFNFKNPIKKYFYSLSSSLNNNSYFENNIIFIPTRVTINKGYFIRNHKDFMTYTLNSYYNNDKNINNEDQNIIGLFSLYLNNKIVNYEITRTNFLDILSRLGGIVKVLFFIFEVLNYLNHHYIIIEDIKELFKIGSGIETEFYYEKDDMNVDNIRHITTKNYKIRQLNTNDELSRNFSPIINKKKLKIPEPSPKSRLSSKKNNLSIYPVNVNNNSNSNKKNCLSKRNTNTFNIKNHDKRKSYLSQGYHIKNKDSKDNSSYINNQSYNEYISYNEENTIEKSSNYLKQKENKENNLKIEPSKKSNNDINFSIRNKKSRKNNLCLPSNKMLEKNERNPHLFLRNTNKERHKSFNYSNQKKRNSILNRNYLMPKISSELINDYSKQILVNNKNLLMTINLNKSNNERNKFDDNNRLDLINNNISEMATSTKNLNAFRTNNNGNLKPSAILKTLIKNKLKLEISEPKEGLGFNQNYLSQKANIFEFLKSLFICSKNNVNKIRLINNFRIKLLSEEHLYRNQINLYLIQKIFQIEESFKFDITELYHNL